MRALNKVRRIKKRRFLYVGLLIVIASWLVFGSFLLVKKDTSKVLAANNAKVVEVISDVSALPQPIDMQYGKTSSNLSEITAKYGAAVTAITKVKLDNLTILSTKLTKISKVNSINASANEQIGSVEQTLRKTSDLFGVLQKFLEYDPATDLRPYATGAEVDASERLSRTQKGMTNTTATLAAESWYYKKDVIDLITPLSNKVTTLTPGQVGAWDTEVTTAQKKILAILQAQHQQNIEQSLQKLEEYSSAYQTL